jgi:hypothetical protein
MCQVHAPSAVPALLCQRNQRRLFLVYFDGGRRNGERGKDRFGSGLWCGCKGVVPAPWRGGDSETPEVGYQRSERRDADGDGPGAAFVPFKLMRYASTNRTCRAVPDRQLAMLIGPPQLIVPVPAAVPPPPATAPSSRPSRHNAPNPVRYCSNGSP